MTGVSGRRLTTCLRGSGAALMAPRTGDSPTSPAGAICTRAACTRSAAGAGSAGRGSPACRPAVLMNTISGARPDRMENQLELCAARLGCRQRLGRRRPGGGRRSAARPCVVASRRLVFAPAARRGTRAAMFAYWRCARPRRPPNRGTTTGRGVRPDRASLGQLLRALADHCRWPRSQQLPAAMRTRRADILPNVWLI